MVVDHSFDATSRRRWHSGHAGQSHEATIKACIDQGNWFHSSLVGMTGHLCLFPWCERKSGTLTVTGGYPCYATSGLPNMALGVVTAASAWFLARLPPRVESSTGPWQLLPSENPVPSMSASSPACPRVCVGLHGLHLVSGLVSSNGPAASTHRPAYRCCVAARGS